MTVKPAIYRPTGTAWTRFKSAIYLAYVNWHLRSAEKKNDDDEFYTRVDALGPAGP